MYSYFLPHEYRTGIPVSLATKEAKKKMSEKKNVKKRKKEKEKPENLNRHPTNEPRGRERKKATLARGTRGGVPNAIPAVPKYHRFHPPHFSKPNQSVRPPSSTKEREFIRAESDWFLGPIYYCSVQ